LRQQKNGAGVRLDHSGLRLAGMILELNNIEVVYNKVVQVLRGLSLSVPGGQVVALLGSNGAGKSTTLKAISRLLELEDGELVSGRIHFDGHDVAASAPQMLVRRGMSHVMEGRRVFEDLTVERSEEHTSELQSREKLVCRLL